MTEQVIGFLQRHINRDVFSGSSLRAKLLRGGAGSLMVKAGQVLLTFAVAVLLARMLGPEDYGVYSFALAIIMLTASLVQIGVPQLVVRETAREVACGDWCVVRGLWRWSNAVVLSSSMLGLLAVVTYIISSPGLDSPRGTTMTVGLLLIPLIAITAVRASCLRGLMRMIWGLLTDSVFRLGFLLLFVTVFALSVNMRNQITPQIVMGLHLLAGLIAFLLSVFVLRRVGPAALYSNVGRKYESRAWRKAMLPLGLTTGLHLVNSYTDLIVLGLLRSDAEVGVYRAVLQVALLTVFGLHAINQVLEPYFAQLFQRGDYNRLQRLATISARLILTFALPPIALFLFAGDEVLAWVFGDAYHAGGVALSIVALAQLFNAAAGSVGVLLNMTRNERYTVIGVAAAVVLNLCLNVLLIPTLGMEGAACATAVSIVVWNLILWYFVRTRLHLRPSALSI